MKKYIFLLLVTIFVASCSNGYKYPNNKQLSEENGALIDSLAHYLPESLTFGGDDFLFSWNEKSLAEIDYFFSTTSEPLLYNYYLGRDVYRLVWSEEGKNTLVLAVNTAQKKAWIASKRFNIERLGGDIDTTALVADTLHTEWALADISPQFDNYTRALEKEEKIAFDSIFQSIDFYHLPNTEAIGDSENYFLLEAHEAERYWYVYRPLDDEQVAKLAKYMRGLTGF